MKNNEKNIREELDFLRENLYQRLAGSGFTDEDVLSASQKLDQVILDYMRSQGYM